MTAALFTGVGVALATLFTSDEQVDVEATAAHAARLVGFGVRAVVVAGSTGEAAALDAAERVTLLHAVRAAVPAGTPVIAGTGGASARIAVAQTEAARAAGATAALCLSPPGVADPEPYYRRVAAAAGDLPLLAYHFPGVSAPGIPVDVLAGLPVVGAKDSSGDPDRLLAELDTFPHALYTGSSALLSFAGPLGCAGAILALANAEPELCATAFDGSAKAQRQLTAAHQASRTDFPRGLKELMAERFGTPVTVRMG